MNSALVNDVLFASTSLTPVLNCALANPSSIRGNQRSLVIHKKFELLACNLRTNVTAL